MAHFKLKVFRNQQRNIQLITIMNTLEIKGDWNVTKGKMKQKWGQLTDNDLTYTNGQTDELVGRIQKRTGQTRDAVEKALKDCECN
jgi:uncharacterized protein YjbJ (UPF0337 family)